MLPMCLSHILLTNAMELDQLSAVGFELGPAHQSEAFVLKSVTGASYIVCFRSSLAETLVPMNSSMAISTCHYKCLTVALVRLQMYYSLVLKLLHIGLSCTSFCALAYFLRCATDLCRLRGIKRILIMTINEYRLLHQTRLKTSSSSRRRLSSI